MDSKNELQHHGILGMKWGKRNGPPYPLSGEQKTRAEKRAEYFREKNHQKKVVKQQMEDRSPKLKVMTDEELIAAIKRLELEKKYAELSVKKVETKKKELSRGEKILQDIIMDSTKNIGTQAMTRFMGDSLNKLMGALFEQYRAEGNEYVNPKKGQKDK